MVRACLDGSKTQTRRVVKPQPPATVKEMMTWHHPKDDVTACFWGWDGAQIIEDSDRCSPYGKPGDRLWVRETWAHENMPHGPYQPGCAVFYRADYMDDPLGPDLERSPDGIRRRWIPSIHMPRAACRLELEVTGVRVEWLQDISEADAVDEGIRISSWAKRSMACQGIYECQMPDGKTHFNDSAYELYRILWDQINGRGAWDANPWVWVIEFKRLKP